VIGLRGLRVASGGPEWVQRDKGGYRPPQRVVVGHRRVSGSFGSC
jgi:hypothetical protein